MIERVDQDELCPRRLSLRRPARRRIISNRTDLSRKQTELGFPLPVKTGASGDVPAGRGARMVAGAGRPPPCAEARARERVRSASKGASRAPPCSEAQARHKARAEAGGLVMTANRPSFGRSRKVRHRASSTRCCAADGAGETSACAGWRSGAAQGRAAAFTFAGAAARPRRRSRRSPRNTRTGASAFSCCATSRAPAAANRHLRSMAA